MFLRKKMFNVINTDSRLGKLISGIKQDLKELVNARIELLKLEAYEKVSAVASLLVYGLIIVLFAFFALSFAFIALGFWFGQLVGSTAGGFGIGAALYLIILVVLFACRKAILSFFTNLFLKAMDPSLTNEEDTYESDK